MKYQTTTYAKALADMLAKKPAQNAEFIGNLKTQLKKNGDLSLFGKILKQTEKLLVKKSGGRHVIIQSARPLSQDKLQELKQNFAPTDFIETVHNPDLIAGVRIMIDGEAVIDASLERKLRKLFK